MWPACKVSLDTSSHLRNQTSNILVTTSLLSILRHSQSVRRQACLWHSLQVVNRICKNLSTVHGIKNSYYFMHDNPVQLLFVMFRGWVNAEKIINIKYIYYNLTF